MCVRRDADGFEVYAMLTKCAGSYCISSRQPGTVNMAMDRTISATTLQDLPDELWLKCTLDTDQGWPRPGLPLGACRRLLEGVLLWRRMSLNLRLGQPEEFSASRKSLLCLAQAFKVPSLHIRVNKGPVPVFEQLADLFAPPAAAAPGGTPWLINITRMTIHCHDEATLCLPELVPDVIAAACPNLTELRLSNLQLGAPIDPLEFILSFSKNGLPVVQPVTQPRHQAAGLQLLHISGCHLNLLPHTFKQQMEELTGLQNFAFEHCKLKFGDEAAYCAGIPSSVSQQLKWFSVYSKNGPPPLAINVLLSSPYPALQTLNLHTAIVDDVVMKLLLENIPSLKGLLVDSFQLKTDYSSTSCPWTLLILQHCDVLSMSLMPVHPGLKVMICAHRPELRLVNTGRGLAADLQATAAAVVAAQKCVRFAFCGDVIADISPSAPQHMQEVLLASVPLLQESHAVQLQGTVIGRALLIALQQYQRIKCIIFAQHCTFEQGIWGSMISLLPHVTDLCMCTPGLNVHGVIVMCAAANRKIDLHIKPKLYPASWYEELQKALQDGAQDLVTMDVPWLL